MAGLLRHLQRDKRRDAVDERRAVIRTDSHEPDPLADLQYPGSSLPSFSGFLQPTMSLPERALADSEAPAKHRREKAAPPPPEEPPEPVWMLEQKRASPQVEMLITSAGRLLDLETVILVGTNGRKDLIRGAVAAASESFQEEFRVTPRMKDQAEGELLKILGGRGPLDEIFRDPDVTDIFIDSHRSIKVLRHNEALETAFRFRSEEEYRLFIGALLSESGRRLSAEDPVVECVLNDSARTRVSALHESLVDGTEPHLSLRIPRLQRVSFFDVLQSKTLPATVAAWLSELIASREATVLVVGPPGSGKTVMLTALLSAIPSNERLVAIERIPEISAATTHLERLIARPAGGTAAVQPVSTRTLIETALMRSPHRIVVGDLGVSESGAFISAVEGGLAGSVGGLTASSAEDAVWKLLDLAAGDERGSQENLMRRIARSVHIVVSMKRIDERPCLVELAEVRPCQHGRFVVAPIVKYAGTNQGKRQWQLQLRTSAWMEALKARGVVLKPGPALLPPAESAAPGEPGAARS